MSSASKEFTIAKLITSGIVSQFLGNIVTFDSWSDTWISRGLSKFLEYHINDVEFEANEMFISEVLHPILQQQIFSSEYPFSVDAALSKEVAQKGEILRVFLHRKVSMSLDVKYSPSFFLAACTFRMIYYATESGVFSQTLKRLIEEK